MNYGVEALFPFVPVLIFVVGLAMAVRGLFFVLRDDAMPKRVQRSSAVGIVVASLGVFGVATLPPSFW